MKDLVGIDIGGSHISSLLVSRGPLGYEVHSPLFTTKVDGKASRSEILSAWQRHLNFTISQSADFSGNVAVAIPGPFEYDKGIARFPAGGKFASLNGINVKENFMNAALSTKNKVEGVRFTNDAASFGLGATAKIDPEREQRAIAITLGTGIGSAFIRSGHLVTSGQGIPPDGAVYTQPFQAGTADDYFSTRWFINRAKEEQGISVKGVKELLETADPETIATIFSNFTTNLRELLQPLLIEFHPDNLLIGGNISRAWPHFAVELEKWLTPQNIQLHQVLDGECSACLGAAIAGYPLTDKYAQS